MFLKTKFNFLEIKINSEYFLEFTKFNNFFLFSGLIWKVNKRIFRGIFKCYLHTGIFHFLSNFTPKTYLPLILDLCLISYIWKYHLSDSLLECFTKTK